MKRLLRQTFLAALVGVTPVATAQAETAIFAGGCFWCVESDLEKLAGVRDVKSGYAGGKIHPPTFPFFDLFLVKTGFFVILSVYKLHFVF